MILDKETLIEIQDYINELDEKFGLKPETMRDVENAIGLAKIEIDNNTCANISGDEKLRLINKLRFETGWSMMDCRDALIKTNWSLDAAEYYLANLSRTVSVRY